MLETLVAADDDVRQRAERRSPTRRRIGMIVKGDQRPPPGAPDRRRARDPASARRADGTKELLEDPRFSTPTARRDNWPALRDTIEQWLETFASVDEAVEALTQARSSLRAGSDTGGGG
jgi:hypothetical protein